MAKNDMSLATTGNTGLESIKALTMPVERLRSVLQKNLGGEALSLNDLEKIKLPSGGSIAWMIPNPTGKPRSAEYIDGVIVGWNDTRAWYKGEYNPNAENKQPDCWSADAIIGHGAFEGQDCASCPMAEYGSAGRGQACKLHRQVFILRSGQLVPTILWVPSTSVKPFKQYLLYLVSQGLNFHDVLTRFSLDVAQSGDKIAYSKLVLEVAEELPEEMMVRSEAYVEQLQPLIEKSTRVRTVVKTTEDDSEPFDEE